ncbi:MAG TPA: hypothetical protein VEL07_04270 [Planctomycetota bacterium]|nr:hypothetical protein [Planctomycetota bacterium]
MINGHDHRQGMDVGEDRRNVLHDSVEMSEASRGHFWLGLGVAGILDSLFVSAATAASAGDASDAGGGLSTGEAWVWTFSLLHVVAILIGLVLAMIPPLSRLRPPGRYQMGSALAGAAVAFIWQGAVVHMLARSHVAPIGLGALTVDGAMIAAALASFVAAVALRASGRRVALRGWG